MRYEARCPHCGLVNTMTENVDGDGPPVPESGDVSICWGCAEVSVFTADGGLRPAEPAELAELRADPDMGATLRRASAVVRLHKQGRLRWGR